MYENLSEVLSGPYIPMTCLSHAVRFYGFYQEKCLRAERTALTATGLEKSKLLATAQNARYALARAEYDIANALAEESSSAWASMGYTCTE